MSLRQIVFGLLMLLMAMLAAAQPPSTPPQGGAPITCALVADPALGLPDSAAFQMLTIELSKQPGLALLERAEVSRLLQERSLQLALAAEGLEARRTLGTLLKARLLVLLRAGERTVGEKKIRFVDLAISETASGLRLVQDELVWDETSPAALGAPVAADVALALARLAQPAAAIVAVPPFLSDDLEHRYDAMQEAYARLLAGTLAGTPGLRLVELAEAQAVADEIRLTGGAKIGRTLLPYYLQGRYRNQRPDGISSPTLTLSLELRRGDRALGQQKSAPLAPDAAGDFLRTRAQALLSPVLKSQPLPFNPDVESAQLLRQARQFEQLGEYEKALTLTEAALLLKPAAPEILKLAIDRATAYLNEPAPGPDPDLVIQRAVAVNLRALDHLALYLRVTEPSNIYPFFDGFLKAGRGTFARGQSSPALARMIQEVGQAKRETVLAYFEYLADHPGVRSVNYQDFNPLADPILGPQGSTPIQESPAATRQALMRMARVFWKRSQGQDFRAIVEIARITLPDPTEDEAYLDGIAALPGKQFGYLAQYARLQRAGLAPAQRMKQLGKISVEVNQAALEANSQQELLRLLNVEASNIALKIELDQAEKNRLRELAGKPAAGPILPAQVTPRPAASDADFTLDPIRIPGLAGLYLQGWIAASGATDLLWTDRGIYRLTPGNPLQQIYFAPPPNGRGRNLRGVPNSDKSILREIVYDGRWAWAPLEDVILVLDPGSGTVEKITEKNGLPPGEKRVAVLGPGRVCVVGGFGRAWGAVIEYHGPGQVKIDVFLEARQVSGAWNDPTVAFKPRFAATLSGDDGQPRVLVGREMEGRGNDAPLLLDPGRRTAQVVPQRISPRFGSVMITTHQGRLYWLASHPLVPSFENDNINAKPPLTHLECFGAPDYRAGILFNNIPDHLRRFDYPLDPFADQTGPGMAFIEDQCYLFLEQFWFLDRTRGRLVQLKGTLPSVPSSIYRVGQSNQYGTVIFNSFDDREGMSCYAFRPRPQLGARLAALPDGVGGERPILRRDPQEGAPLLLRRYHTGNALAYSTVTLPLLSERIFLEDDELSTQTFFLIYGAEQPDSRMRAAVGDDVIFCGHGLGHVEAKTPQIRKQGDPYIFHILPNVTPGGPRRPISIRLTDALGQPLAGAAVRFVCHYQDPVQMMSNGGPHEDFSDYSFELFPQRTDAEGRLIMTPPTNPYVSLPICRISHPDYGTAWCSLPDRQYPTRRPNSPATGASPGTGVDLTLKTALVRHGSAEGRTAFSGRLVDARNQPVPDAWIIAYLQPTAGPVSLPLIINRNAVLSGPDGRFTLYPVNFTPTPQMPALPANSTMVVHVRTSENPVKPPNLEATLDNRSEYTLKLPANQARPHTLAFQDESGHHLSAAQVLPQISRIHRSDVIVTTSENIFDGELRASDPGELKLVPGHYEVESQFFMTAASFEVTPASPYEIVVTLKRTPSSGGARPANPAAGAGRPAMALSYKGQVVNGRTGKPMPGVYVVAQHNIASAEFSAAQWREMHALQGPLNLEDAALKPLCASPVPYFKNVQRITRTDAAGRFSLSREPWETFNNITALEEGYLPANYNSNLSSHIPTSGTQGLLPLYKLYPSGHVKIEVRTVPPEDRKQEHYLIWSNFAFTNPADGIWRNVFPLMPNQTALPVYTNNFRPNQPTTLLLPAGVRYRMTMTPHSSASAYSQKEPLNPVRWVPEKIEREIELKQGETLDLGTLTFSDGTLAP